MEAQVLRYRSGGENIAILYPTSIESFENVQEVYRASKSSVGRSRLMDDKQDMTGSIRNPNPNKSHKHLEFELT